MNGAEPDFSGVCRAFGVVGAAAVSGLFAAAVRLAGQWERWELTETFRVLVEHPDLTWAEVAPVVRQAGRDWRNAADLRCCSGSTAG